MGSLSVNVTFQYFPRSTYGAASTLKHNTHCMIKPTFIDWRDNAGLIRAVSEHPSGKKEKHFDLYGIGARFSKSARAVSDKRSFPSSLGEMAVELIIGSLFFLASVNVRPAVALPAQTSANVEEMSDRVNNDKLDVEDKGDEIVGERDANEIVEDKDANNIVEDKDANNIVEDKDATNVKIEDEGLYLKLLEENPRGVEALKVVLNIMIRKGELKDAVRYVERLIDIEPEEVEWRLLEAFCYDMMGQLSKAKKLFKGILKKRPLLIKALHGLAMVMTKNFEGPAVYQMLNKALELASGEKKVSEERNIRMLIAQMHLVQGDLDGALSRFQDLAHQNPRDFRPYLCQGIIYSLQDKEKEAEEQFKIYQSLVPEEFPERGYLDEVVGLAKTESRDRVEKGV